MRIVFFILVIFVSTALAQTPFEKGTQLAKSGDYGAALENYRKAASIAETEKTNDNFRGQIHYNIGVCLYKLKQNVEAVGEFNEALNLNYQKAFYALGMAQTELRNWQEAEAAFHNFLKIKKNYGEAWFDLALVYLAEKDFTAAKEAFQNSIKYKSTAAADAHNNLGVILVLQDNWILGVKEFETALTESNGKSIEANKNLKFCKFYKQAFGENLIAKLEFSQRDQ